MLSSKERRKFIARIMHKSIAAQLLSCRAAEASEKEVWKKKVQRYPEGDLMSRSNNSHNLQSEKHHACHSQGYLGKGEARASTNNPLVRFRYNVCRTVSREFRKYQKAICPNKLRTHIGKSNSDAEEVCCINVEPLGGSHGINNLKIVLGLAEEMTFQGKYIQIVTQSSPVYLTDQLSYRDTVKLKTVWNCKSRHINWIYISFFVTSPFPKLAQPNYVPAKRSGLKFRPSSPIFCNCLIHFVCLITMDEVLLAQILGKVRVNSFLLHVLRFLFSPSFEKGLFSIQADPQWAWSWPVCVKPRLPKVKVQMTDRKTGKPSPVPILVESKIKFNHALLTTKLAELHHLALFTNHLLPSPLLQINSESHALAIETMHTYNQRSQPYELRFILFVSVLSREP
ncbi:uncharacterized protein BDR25DRAFT_357036 [Lindgomyces ingoldianus]|uniref:Uncharacterized protein n=1 Tax=Lindgomyces ingoldianus TaxID=673940 RepID=A0ACB6QNY6_9PLEO|nr:uncharacterized protein BDR25DRAFT_357036 [Lindgomyces ingoldianus]KAF2468678.1 hypothetical protein BDR25DRAFT_357036 [Lindgomyces ingoldianus]